MTRRDARRRVFSARWSLRPSPGSRWLSSRPRSTPVSRAGWCWPMPVTGPTARSARASPRSACSIAWACNRLSVPGLRTWSLCRPNPGAGPGASPRDCCATTPTICPFPPRRWRWAPARCLAKRVLARGLQRYAVLALLAAIRVRPASGEEKLSTSRPFEWFLVEWPEGEEPAEEILALDIARGCIDRSPRRQDQIALAHRTRLGGTEERTGPRAFRGAGLARLPPSRHALRRGLWIPDPQESGPFPLWTQATQRTSPFPSSATPRRPRSDPSDTSRTLSRR